MNETKINPAISPSSLFPLNYHHAVWVPVGLALAGFFGLESMLHLEGSNRTASTAVPAAFLSVRELMGFPVWRMFYRTGYLILALPILLPAIRAVPGALRRLLAAYAAILLFGSILAVLPGPGILDIVPCLLMAASTLVTAFSVKNGFPILGAAAIGGTLTAAVSTLMIEVHGADDLLSGIATGAMAYRIAFSRALDFLDCPHPWISIEHELRDAWNLLVANRRENWERAYAAGSWDFLDSRSQRGRHYVISGIVADLTAKGQGEILDVGCGLGTLYQFVRGRIGTYTGIDLSEEVVRRCRSKFASERNCFFLQSAFEDFSPEGKFDVVVLNEVLYYFPIDKAVEVYRKALSLLMDGGVVVISMNRNRKARSVWRRIRSVARPLQSLKITNLESGSYWTVEAYGRHPEAPQPNPNAKENKSDTRQGAGGINMFFFA